MGILLIAPLGQVAKAYSPYLSASWENNNNVRIVVNQAQPYMGVDVYYQNTNSTTWNVTTNVCTTNSSGYCSVAVDLGLQQGVSASVYAKIGSDQTSTATIGGSGGCWGSNCGSGNLAFSNANPSLSVGQSQSVTIYSNSSYYYGNYYISSNSNSSVVTANISGSTISLYGSSAGSASITVCQSGGYSYSYGNNCGTIYVTVGGGMTGNITFSNTNPSLTVGQSMSVTVSAPYFYSGSFYISSNSNSSVVSANMSGNTINLYGSSAGSSTLSVCLSGGSYACANLYVTVSGSGGCWGGNCGSGNITFSQSNVSLSVGQSQSVTIYSNNSYYYGNYSVSSSNPNVATANVSGNTLNLYGQNTGSANITVCQSGYSSNCGTLYVNVGSSGSFYLSPTSVTLNPGQTTNVTANFAYTYSGYLYLGSNSNPNVASATFSGSQVSVYGINPGSTTMSICYSGQCNNLYVTVNGNACYSGYGCGGDLYFTTTSLPQPTVNQYYSYQLQVTGGSGNYTYYINSGSLPAGLSLSTSGLISGTAISTSPASFSIRASDAYGRTATASLTLTPVGGNVLGASIYSNGSLIREDGTVYIVYRNTKSGFASASAFRGLGFSFGQVVLAYNSGLTDSGYVISTSRAAHPWGSWIKSGGTVYFVHQDGLIPVPSADVFTNNGGQWGLVVPANGYDSRPLLPVMDYGDYRLK